MISKTGTNFLTIIIYHSITIIIYILITVIITIIIINVVFCLSFSFSILSLAIFSTSIVQALYFYSVPGNNICVPGGCNVLL